MMGSNSELEGLCRFLNKIQTGFCLTGFSIAPSRRYAADLVSLDVLISAMRQSELFEELLVDGSFVTGKAAPNDIDIIAVLGTEANFERELTMFEYSLLSGSLLRRRFGFDVLLARRHSSLYTA